MEIRFDDTDNRFTLRAAALIIHNQQLLVVKNSAANCCYTIGGGVRIGETTEEAVLRECYEEIGVSFVIDRLVFVQERFFTAGGKQHHEVVFFYLMKPCAVSIAHDRPTDQANEILYWLPLDQLKTAPLVPSFLKKALAKLPQTVAHIVTYE